MTMAVYLITDIIPWKNTLFIICHLYEQPRVAVHYIYGQNLCKGTLYPNMNMEEDLCSCCFYLMEIQPQQQARKNEENLQLLLMTVFKSKLSILLYFGLLRICISLACSVFATLVLVSFDMLGCDPTYSCIFMHKPVWTGFFIQVGYFYTRRILMYAFTRAPWITAINSIAYAEVS